MKRQTPEQRIAIKKILKDEMGDDSKTFQKILNLHGNTLLQEKSSGDHYVCIEVQLKGCLVERGLRRRYVSYVDLYNYELVHEL